MLQSPYLVWKFFILFFHLIHKKLKMLNLKNCSKMLKLFKNFRLSKVAGIDCRTSRLVSYQTNENGILVNRSSYKVCEADDSFGVADLSLGNIASVGALEKLKPTIMNNHDYCGVAQGFDNLMQSVENSQDSTNPKN